MQDSMIIPSLSQAHQRAFVELTASLEVKIKSNTPHLDNLLIKVLMRVLDHHIDACRVQL